MLPFLKDQFGNASSSHKFGQTMNKAVREGRQQVADLIGADAKEVIFTSGATEAINLALKGIALAPATTKRHIVTVQTEHKAVLDTCKFLETVGFEVTYLPVNKDGLINHDLFKKSLRADTLLASVMLVNNETGVIQDVKALSSYCKAVGVLFMSDATQAVGKLPVNAEDLGIDIMAFSGHKFYGPKGIGGLYISREMQQLSHLQPLVHGGGHENGFRSGTLNVPAIVGMGKAAEIASEEMINHESHVRRLRDELEENLLKIEGSFVNGNVQSRLYNTSNICFPGIDANILIGQLPNLALSNGSACTAAVVEPSHVLTAMGLNNNQALASLRISIGKFTLGTEIKSAINVISTKLISLKKASLYT